jgi:hypothetical protein
MVDLTGEKGSNDIHESTTDPVQVGQRMLSKGEERNATGAEETIGA